MTNDLPSPVSVALNTQLEYLKLGHLREHYESLAQQAAREQWTHVGYLARLIEGEAAQREQRAIERRIRLARFPTVKTLDQFQWTWPRKINRMGVQHLFRLDFLQQHANVIFLGGVGLGKTHLSIALGRAACLRGHSVLFTTVVEAINTLCAAQAAGRLKAGGGPA